MRTKQDIQASEIKKLLNYFSENKIDKNNPDDVNLIRESIKKIFQEEVKELGLKFDVDSNENSDIILQFDNDRECYWRGNCKCDRIKNQNGEFVDTKPRILFNEYYLYCGLDSKEDETRISACTDMFRIIFHELQHYRQYLKMQSNVCSKEGIRFARDWVFSDSGLVDYTIYMDNYEEFLIENDANEKAYLETNEKARNFFSNEKIYFKSLKKIYSEYRYEFEPDVIVVGEKSDISVEILDKLIVDEGKTDLLLMYPILQKEYNLDGTKKDAKKLISDMRSEIENIEQDSTLLKDEIKEVAKDTYEMYYELIYRALQKVGKDNISDLYKEFGEKDVKTIIQNMLAYFESEKKQKIEMINNQKIDTNKYIFHGDDEYKLQIDRDGKKILISHKDFFEMLDNEKMGKKLKYKSQGKEKIKTAKDLVEKYLKEYVPKSGKYVLKNGTIVSVKEFIEDYFIEQFEIADTADNIKIAIKNFVKNMVKSQTEADKILTIKNVEEHFDNRISFLNEIINEKTRVLDEEKIKIKVFRDKLKGIREREQTNLSEIQSTKGRITSSIGRKEEKQVAED